MMEFTAETRRRREKAVGPVGVWWLPVVHVVGAQRWQRKPRACAERLYAESSADFFHEIAWRQRAISSATSARQSQGTVRTCKYGACHSPFFTLRLCVLAVNS